MPSSSNSRKRKDKSGHGRHRHDLDIYTGTEIAGQMLFGEAKDDATVTQTILDVQSSKGDAKIVKENARRRSYGVRPLAVLVGTLNIFLSGGLLVYLVIVSLNLVFTFENLQDTDIPYHYNQTESDAEHRSADRYGRWWWIVALQFLRIYSLWGTHVAISRAALTGRTEVLWFMEKWLMVYGIWDVAMGIYILVPALSSRCGSVPICRDWSSGQTEAEASANWIFLLLGWGTLAWALVHIAYYNIVTHAMTRVREALAG